MPEAQLAPQSAATRIVTAGAVVDTDPLDVPAQVFRLYRAAFSRESDPAGLGYHIGYVESRGSTLTDISANFIASPEFASKYGSLGTSQFVTQLYTNVLNRAPDADGLSFHVNNIASGRTSRAQVLIGFSESPENKGATAAVIARGITFYPLAPPAPAGINLLPATLFYGATSAGSTFELGAGRFAIAGQKRSTGAEQVVMRSPEGNLTASWDPARASTVIKDDVEKLNIVSEAGPKGTVIRAYSSTGAFVAGYYLEAGSGGQRTLWKMIADGSTQPSNLKSGRVFTGARASLPMSGTDLQPTAGSDTCYGFMGQVTGSGASYASETGEVMDQDDNAPAARRAGRVARLIGVIWSRVPRMCPDAPDPISDAEFGKEILLEATKATGGSGVRALLEKYQRFEDFVSQNSRLAQTLRQLLAKLTPAERAAVGSAARASGIESVLSDPEAAVANARASVAPAKVYISSSDGCVDSTLSGSSRTFVNGCGHESRVSWCQSGGPMCTLTNSTVVAPGGTYRFSAQYFQNFTALWYAACPSVYQGRAVLLQEVGGGYYNCSYSTF
jgi:hypothetical protein